MSSERRFYRYEPFVVPLQHNPQSCFEIVWLRVRLALCMSALKVVFLAVYSCPPASQPVSLTVGILYTVSKYGLS